MASIKEAVAEKLGSVGPAVKDSVIDILVQQETERRTNAVVTVIKKIDEATKELKKIDRPDDEKFNADGSVAAATYTKDRIQNITKSKEQIAKMNAAIELALEKNDFSKVLEFAQKPAEKPAKE